MIKSALTTVLACIGFLANAQWLPLSAGSSYPLTGDLYLNSRLYATGSNSNFSNNFSLIGTGANTFNIYPYIDGNTYLQHDGTVIFSAVGSITPQLVISPSGNVGIGTPGPSSTLDVNGILHSYVSADANLKLSKPTGAAIQFDNGSGLQNALIEANNADNNLHFMTNNSSGSGLSERMRITNSGNVLIAQTTQSNANYKLDVAGAVRANEIVVNVTGADFVFEKDYKLPKLTAVKNYLDKNHHLPGIASANEMSTSGAALGALDNKLLQKVEELTLYMIELKEQNDQQRQALVRQQKMNRSLQRQVGELTAKLLPKKLTK